MAFRAANIVRNFGKFLKFRDFRFKEINVKSKRIEPAINKSEIIQNVKYARREKTYWVWKLTRGLFRNPQLFRRIPIAPFRLGLCLGLALNVNDSQEFRHIHEVTSACMKSGFTEGNRLNLSSLRELETGKYLTKGCQGAVYAARPSDAMVHLQTSFNEDTEQWPLAIKVLFNYRNDDQTNDDRILENFEAETVPYSVLPPHPSITKVHGCIVEDIPQLPEAENQFPIALPPSLYPNLGDDMCYGARRTLFLIMERYSSSLHEKLARGPLSHEECLQVLIQLLEGDVFLKNHGIAHRDLTTKNILIDDKTPGLLKASICDFGCATDQITKISKGHLNTCPGTPALQAPEVANFQDDVRQDYRKADLWTLGTLVYEMYKPGSNPFTKKDDCLDSRYYEDADLPPVENAPLWIDNLVHEMLRKDVMDRPSSEICAAIIHLMYLQIPRKWIISNDEVSVKEICDWLALKVATLIINHRNNHMVYFHLTFLNRITQKELNNCLEWLRHIIFNSH